MMKAYIAGPYSSNTETLTLRNIEKARKLSEQLWVAGFSVFCPHLNTAHMGGLLPHERFVDGDLEWLKHADILFLLPGWNKSVGAKAEERMAELCEIPSYLHYPVSLTFASHYLPPQTDLSAGDISFYGLTVIARTYE